MDPCTRIFGFFFGFFISVASFGQRYLSGMEEAEATIAVEAFHFPADLSGNLNNRAELRWQADPELSAGIALFQDTYGAFSERVRLEAVLRKSLQKGLYLFTGMSVEREVNPEALRPGTNVGWMGGAGYAPNQSLSVEAGLMFSVTRPQIGSFGSASGQNGPFLRARLRY